MLDPGPENLTPAGQRSLESAERLARDCFHVRPGPTHLLRALVADESEAQAVLEGLGVGFDEIMSGLPLEDAVCENGDSTKKGAIGFDIWAELLADAGRFRSLTGGDAEVQSEHLLCAIAAGQSSATRFLSERGITVDTLSRFLADKHNVELEPIAVDIRIELDRRTRPEQHDILRIVDAAANRAREGLRVVEDFVRFTLNDELLSRCAKACRHELTEALQKIDPAELLRNRNTQNDVGTEISLASETTRGGAAHVVTANLKRFQESARTLEEFGKCISAGFAQRIEALRYESYTLEKALMAVVSGRGRLAGRVLHVLLTQSACKRDWEWTARSIIDAGAGIVQLREKTIEDRELLDRARRLRKWTQSAGALLIVNDRPDITVAAGADGIHVGEDDMPVSDVRRIVGSDCLIGVSTHTVEQARGAVLAGADYLGVGPVFSSASKSFERLAGLEFVREVAELSSLPWFAIGGIGDDNLSQVIEAGASRIAVSSDVCGAPDPAATVRRLTAKLVASAPEMASRERRTIGLADDSIASES